MSKLGIALRKIYLVNFSCARRCVLTLLRVKLRVMLRATPLKVAMLQTELCECSSRTTSVNKSCDFKPEPELREWASTFVL